MAQDIPDFMEAAEPAADKLDALRAKAAELREVQTQLEDYESRVTELKMKQHVLTRSELPELFAAAQVTSVGLEAQGNLPAYIAELGREFRAGIPATWEPDRREKGFTWLIEHDGEDIIKTVLTIEFEKGEASRAMDLRDLLVKEHGIAPEDITVDMAVHHATLTSFLRELVETDEGGKIPDGIDAIGGYVGPVVKLKKPKEGKGRKR